MAQANKKEKVTTMKVKLGENSADLQKAVAEANIQLAKAPATVTIGRLGPSKLQSPDENKAIREATKALIGDVQEHVRLLGDVLGDEETFDWQREAVAAEEQQLADCVASVQGAKGRNEVLREYMFAMINSFPHTSLAINHLGDQGVRIGFFRRSTGRGEFSIELPLTDVATGRWKRAHVASDVPLSIRVMSQLLPILHEIEQGRGEDAVERKRRVVALKQGTQPLLDVLASGEGETFCYVPERKDGDRKFAEANIRLYVAGGLVTVTGVVGGKFVEGLEGVSISTEFLKSNKRIGDAMSADDLHKKIALRRFIEDGMAYVQKEAAKAQAAQVINAAKLRIAKASQSKPVSETSAAEPVVAAPVPE